VKPKVKNQEQPEKQMLPKLLSMGASLSVALQVVEQKIMKESEEKRADVT
jgi:hypothetical protein